MKVNKGVGLDEAANAVKNDLDVIADNRKIAAEIARKAGGGKRPVHDPPHGPVAEGYRPHYHPFERKGGHVFYGIALILAPNSIEVSENPCPPTNGQFAAAVVWDIASTIDPSGISDVINYAVGLN